MWHFAKQNKQKTLQQVLLKPTQTRGSLNFQQDKKRDSSVNLISLAQAVFTHERFGRTTQNPSFIRFSPDSARPLSEEVDERQKWDEKNLAASLSEMESSSSYLNYFICEGSQSHARF